MSFRELLSASSPGRIVPENGYRSPARRRHRSSPIANRATLAAYILTLSALALVVSRSSRGLRQLDEKRKRSAAEVELNRYFACNDYIARDVGLTADKRLAHFFSR